MDKGRAQVKRFLDGLLTFLGVTVIVYTVYMLITNFGEFGQENTAYDFIVPVLLTLFYLPFVFLMMVYSTYERVFLRLRFTIKEDKLRFVAKAYAILFFNFRLALLERWSSQISREEISSHEGLINSFKNVCRVISVENGASEVSFDDGWSPYQAKNFLSGEGLVTGHYEKQTFNEWFASSPALELGGEILPDNVAYYVKGLEGVAKVLKVILNVNDASRSHAARSRFSDIAELLINSSLKMNMTEATKNALLAGASHCESYGRRSVSVRVNLWDGHKFGGYDIELMISVI